MGGLKYRGGNLNEIGHQVILALSQLSRNSRVTFKIMAFAKASLKLIHSEYQTIYSLQVQTIPIKKYLINFGSHCIAEV